MEQINLNDIVFATATIRGKLAANLRLSGLKSIGDVINAVKAETGSVTGLLTITLRNMTQGWSQSKSVYMSQIPVRAGRQLTLF